MLDRHMSESLDRFLTGNYGEDFLADDEPQGCRTLCGTCRKPIELELSTYAQQPVWAHVGGGDGTHEPTPAKPAPLTLPREVFTDPARLVDLLADSAEHHGWTVDRSEHTRSTQIAAARMLVQILIPADPDATQGGVR